MLYKLKLPGYIRIEANEYQSSFLLIFLRVDDVGYVHFRTNGRAIRPSSSEKPVLVGGFNGIQRVVVKTVSGVSSANMRSDRTLVSVLIFLIIHKVKNTFILNRSILAFS